MKLYTMQADLACIADAVVSARAQARTIADSLSKEDPLALELNEMTGRLDNLYHRLVATSEGWLAREEQLRERVIDLYSSVMNYGGRPSASHLTRLAALEVKIADAGREFQMLSGDQLQKINTQLEGRGIQPIRLLTLDDFRKKEG
jgi:hypothetical protein